MLTLALDTSSEWGSLALGSTRELISVIEFRGPMRHSTTLFPALSRINLPSREIGRIIVGLGPGSFSGIRVALASAQGIAATKNAQVIGICSAWSIARQNPTIKKLGVFADARREEFFCTEFCEGQMTRPTYLLPRSEAADHAKQFDLAISAEPLHEIPHRAYPRAVDYLAFHPDSPAFVHEQNLEPIHLREDFDQKK